MTTTNSSYRYGVYPDVQGVGFIENTGSEWLKPASKTGGMEVFDDEGQEHTLVLDLNDGYFYDITTRDGPSGSGIVKAARDKVLKDGTGGTQIISSIWFSEDRGSTEDLFIRGKIFHVYVRPEKESNRNESGYNSTNGLPTGIEFDLYAYEDGEPLTANATAEVIPYTGDIAFDKEVEAHRVQLRVSSSQGQHILTGIQADYVAEDRPAENEFLTQSKDDWQKEIALPTLWASYLNGTLINRTTGSEISVTSTQVTAPDGTSNGVQISAATTFGSASVATLLVWANGTIAVSIGGTSIALTPLTTSGVWTLHWAHSLVLSGDVIITPTGTVTVFDLRTFNSATTTGARTYYWTDIINNNGLIVIPR